MLPFAHHDLVCHLKSSTHCSTCHIGTSDDEGRPDPAVAAVSLADAGRADESPLVRTASCVPSPSSGRSPPAALTTVF
jgi:hypothetical protein